MRVISVNVGLPRETVWRGERVTTGIFKEPVAGPVRVAGVNLEGDGQADLTVHGGADKAVYVYPAEHYAYWQVELGRDLPWAAFGENLTVEGMPLEDAIGIGDRLRIGTAELVVTQPRLPCFKLGIRFEDPRMVGRFFVAARTGYYLRIVTEGDVAAGDEIVFLERHPAAVPVSEITRVFSRDQDDTDAVLSLLSVDALPEVWRSFFEQLAAAGSGRASRR
jgi:MOSC domain-containing protein YiiM